VDGQRLDRLEGPEYCPHDQAGWLKFGACAANSEVGGWEKAGRVVWTILPPRFNNIERVPTLSEVVNYLKGLKGSEHQRAERYIRNAPPDILTSYRAAIENALGWTCNQSATQNEIC
jgi:hypothetical protein